MVFSSPPSTMLVISTDTLMNLTLRLYLNLTAVKTLNSFRFKNIWLALFITEVTGKTHTWQNKMGERLSNSSTSTRFLSGLGWKKNVSPSSRGMADENSGSSSSSPRCAI